MANIAVSFRAVWKSYPQARGELHALRDVSVDVVSGRRIAITGRSGSGKSTFLHLAAGIDRPSRGAIQLLGHDLSGISDSECTRMRRDHVGLVFQFFHLLPHLNVFDNVVLPAMIAGDSKRKYGARAAELLGRVGLDDRRDDTVEKLSGGEMQRVAICRALLRKPGLLLADEPTGNLDDENGRRVMDLLLRLVDEERSTLIFVTHSDELAALADETWKIHSGILERS
jgi:putative ABC transport system ATP-binding protein